MRLKVVRFPEVDGCFGTFFGKKFAGSFPLIDSTLLCIKKLRVDFHRSIFNHFHVFPSNSSAVAIPDFGRHLWVVAEPPVLCDSKVAPVLANCVLGEVAPLPGNLPVCFPTNSVSVCNPRIFLSEYASSLTTAYFFPASRLHFVNLCVQNCI